MKELLVVAIEEMYRNHPMPQLPNFKIIPWEDQETIHNADIYLQNNILGQKRKSLNKYYQYIIDIVGLVIIKMKAIIAIIIVLQIDGFAYKKNNL